MENSSKFFFKSNAIKVLATYTGVIILTLLGLFLINYFDISYPLSVTNHNASGDLAVVGEGKVDVVPDLATVEAGVVVNDAKTVEEAQQKINEVNNKIIQALEGLGIEKKDVKTSNYSINPNYVFDGGRNSTNGYNGNVNISIKLRDTSKLADVISNATEAGANTIYGTNYTVENPEKYRQEARTRAIENAKEQAQKLSSELGIRLGKVVNVVESSPSTPPMFYAKEVALSADMREVGTANLEPGSQTISSVVTLYFDKR